MDSEEIVKKLDERFDIRDLITRNEVIPMLLALANDLNAENEKKYIELVNKYSDICFKYSELVDKFLDNERK